jgi:hypothetical protein
MNVAQLLMQEQKQPDQSTLATDPQMHPEQLAAFQKQLFSMHQLMTQMAGSAGNPAAALSNEMLLAQFLPKFTADSMPKLESNEQSPSAQSNNKSFSAFAIDSLTAANHNSTPNKRDSSNSDIDTINEDEPHSPNGNFKCVF